MRTNKSIALFVAILEKYCYKYCLKKNNATLTTSRVMLSVAKHVYVYKNMMTGPCCVLSHISYMYIVIAKFF